MSKSYEHPNDPIVGYCTKLTVKQTPTEKELEESTIKNHQHYGMLGAPEVLQFGKNFIHLIGAKRVLDIGTFTGASALAWATALPADGEVQSFDVDHSALKSIGLPIIKKHPELEKRITFNLGPAVEKLDELIGKGESGKYDLAFIDADKINYTNYYKKCMKLLRSGGVILVDNALWNNAVTKNPSTFDASTKAIDECNKYIFEDESSNSTLLTIGDGVHVAFKK
uniref:O-methyltransferase n=1 Tax=Panagrolaimus sp. PS1159 TaxID=55785 RepID=A0AC35FFJ2_9BILA